MNYAYHLPVENLNNSSRKFWSQECSQRGFRGCTQCGRICSWTLISGILEIIKFCLKWSRNQKYGISQTLKLSNHDWPIPTWATRALGKLGSEKKNIRHEKDPIFSNYHTKIFCKKMNFLCKFLMLGKKIGNIRKILRYFRGPPLAWVDSNNDFKLSSQVLRKSKITTNFKCQNIRRQSLVQAKIDSKNEIKAKELIKTCLDWDFSSTFEKLGFEKRWKVKKK